MSHARRPHLDAVAHREGGSGAAGASTPTTRAAAAIAKGELAVVPTETVYAVLGKASDAGAVRTLAALQDKAATALAELLGSAGPSATATSGGTRPWTLHCAKVDDVIRIFGLDAPAHRRAVRMLLPGPVRFVIETTPAQAIKVCGALGVQAEVIDHDGLFAVRVPDHPTCLDVLSKCDFAVVGTNSRSIGLSTDAGGDLVDDAPKAAKELGIHHVIDEGPTRMRKRSAGVRLSLDGDWRVESIGAVDERWIRKKVEFSVLLVCTGNTCRSPMAQSLAQHEIGEGALGAAQHIPVRVESAGVAASSNAPMTREAREALLKLGVEPHKHASRMVNKDLVREADVIYALTRSHAQRLLESVPEARGKVFLLDPQGQDVTDPIGGTLDDYVACATLLRSHVRERVKEIASALEHDTELKEKALGTRH